LTTEIFQFIEKVTGRTGLSGPGKAHHEKDVLEFKVSLPEFGGSEICFIETPGFDDSEEVYIDVFKMVSEWLKQLYVLGYYSLNLSSFHPFDPSLLRYNEGRDLTGLLYFHRITDGLSGPYVKNLKDLRQLHEDESDKLIYTTTMWDIVDMTRGLRREDELKEVYLESVLNCGASIERFMNNRQSAIDILSLVMNRGLGTSRTEHGYDVEDRPGEDRPLVVQRREEAEFLSEEEDENENEEEEEGDEHEKPRREQEEHMWAERQPTSSKLPASRPPTTSVENDDLVPSATPEPSSITVPLHRLPATSTPEDDDSVPSTNPEPLSIIVPLRLPPASTSEDDNNSVPSAAPEPPSITLPLYRLPATSTSPEADDFVPSATPEPSSITIPLFRSPSSSRKSVEDDFVPSAAPEPSSITIPLYRSVLSTGDDDFVASAVPEPLSIMVPLFRSAASSTSIEDEGHFISTAPT